MASMNRGLNLPAIQKIMNEFERESAMMDMKEEMMSEAVDDVMDDEGEDEEEEGDKILSQVLEEIGIDIQQKVDILNWPILKARTDILSAYGCSYGASFCLCSYGQQEASGCHRWR